MLHSRKLVWRERTRLTGPVVWAGAIPKVWCDSGRATFSPPHSGRSKGLCYQGGTTVIQFNHLALTPPPPPPYPQQWHLPSFFANDTQLRALHDFCGHYYLWVSTSMEVNTLAHIGCLILTKSPRLKWYVSLSCAVGSSGEWLMTLEWNKVKYITWQHLSRHSERGSCQVVWLVWVIQLVK